MKRFIDKNGEVFTMISESAFDNYVFKTMYYLVDVDSAGIEDHMRELCGRIFGRYPNERPEELQKKIKALIYKTSEKLLKELKDLKEGNEA